MNALNSNLPEALHSSALNALQAALVDLIDLSLLAKQAHWNIRGPHFRSLHEFLDQIVDSSRTALDDVAERSVTLGGEPDGRSITVAASTLLPQLENGHLDDSATVKTFASLVREIADRMRERIAATESEPVTQDLLIGITGDLEKQQWMLRAQL